MRYSGNCMLLGTDFDPRVPFGINNIRRRSASGPRAERQMPREFWIFPSECGRQIGAENRTGQAQIEAVASDGGGTGVCIA
jgi:hypothetical protein